MIVRNTESLAAHDNVEVHAEDADSRIVLDTKIDMLVNTEAKVAGLGEVLFVELVLLDLEATFKNLKRLVAAHCAGNGNLLVTADAEGANGVSRLGENWLLSSQLLKHLGSASQLIARLTHAQVEAELLEMKLAHGVRLLLVCDRLCLL